MKRELVLEDAAGPGGRGTFAAGLVRVVEGGSGFEVERRKRSRTGQLTQDMGSLSLRASPEGSPEKSSPPRRRAPASQALALYTGLDPALERLLGQTSHTTNTSATSATEAPEFRQGAPHRGRGLRRTHSFNNLPDLKTALGGSLWAGSALPSVPRVPRSNSKEITFYRPPLQLAAQPPPAGVGRQAAGQDEEDVEMTTSLSG